MLVMHLNRITGRLHTSSEDLLRRGSNWPMAPLPLVNFFCELMASSFDLWAHKLYREAVINYLGHVSLPQVAFSLYRDKRSSLFYWSL